MNEQILPVGTIIVFPTGWRWRVEPNNIIHCLSCADKTHKSDLAIYGSDEYEVQNG